MFFLNVIAPAIQSTKTSEHIKVTLTLVNKKQNKYTLTKKRHKNLNWSQKLNMFLNTNQQLQNINKQDHVPCRQIFMESFKAPAFLHLR